MSLKFKIILMSIICTLTLSLFTGCDLWKLYDTATPPPFTNGINPTDKSKDPNFKDSDEDLVGDSLLDPSELYDFLGGVKIAYDGTENKLEALANPNFQVVYSLIADQAMQNNSIDCQKFVENNSGLSLTPQFVSQVVWIFNYVNQYKALASMILTSIVQNYGFGLSTFTLNNGLYGKVDYEAYDIQNNGYATNENAINLAVYEVGQNVTISNPNLGSGEAIFDNGFVQVDFNTLQTLQIAVDFDIPTKAYCFNLNLKESGVSFAFTIDNPYYDPDNIVNQPQIDNPDYDSTDPDSPQKIANPKYIADHIFSKQQLTIVGQVGANNIVAYELGNGQISNPTADEFAKDYVETFSNHLGLKLLQAHLFTANIIDVAPELVSDLDYVDLYGEWSQKINMLGFAETLVDDEENQHLLSEIFAKVVLDSVVGQDVLSIDESVGTFSRDLQNTIKQIVQDCLTAKLSQSQNNLVFDSINGQPCFPKVYNIEWKDYTAEELFKTDENGDTMSLPEEKILSFLVMLKQDYDPIVFQSIMLMMLAPNEDLKVELNFRYVKNGEEKINDFIDYNLQPPPESGLTNTFDGNIEKYDGQEITMEYADEHCFAIEDYNTPKINTIKNQELLIEKFENLLPSDFCASLNSTLGESSYAYDESKGIYSYNKIQNCDFVEIGFKISSQAENPTLKLQLTLMDVLSEGLDDVQNQ